jgi:hypothetical protein
MSVKPSANDGLTFGTKLAHSSRKKVDFQLSDDKKAFDLVFDAALAAGVGTPSFDGLKKTRAPVSTNVYSAVIPATGKGVKTAFAANGFGVVEPGAHTMLLLAVNDQHRVVHFDDAEKGEQGFTVAVEYRAKVVTDIRLTLLLVAERDSTHKGASALIAVTNLSADAALVKKKPTRGAPKKR